MEEPFLYIYGVFAVDRKVFSKISPEDQQVFREIMGHVFSDLNRINRQDNVNALKTLRKQGIEFIKVPAASLAKWYNDAAAVPKRLIEAGRLSQEMAYTLENLLKEYRSKQPDTDD